MTIALFGTGLIGGSLMLRLKEQGLAQKVYGIDLDSTHLQTALKLGIIDEISSPDTLPQNTDLVVLAVPVDVTQKILPSILDRISRSSVVMDVGSTKQGIAEAVEAHQMRGRFVAFHPMWGTENSGPESAQLDSFESKAGVICDPEKSDKDALDTVESLVRSLGMNILHMSARDHDLHTAYISHISHITSYALANTVLEKEREEDTIFQLASSGFSSTVRLAKSHPDMWVPIFKQNKENVLDVLNEHISQLRKFKSALEKENYELLEELILNANRIRPILEEK
ncbi:prephenate dehydrogenase [Chryseobacterium sp. A301]